jgi:hypothetical protein
LDSPKNDPASHSGLYSELGGSTWADGSGRPAGVNLPARAASFTGDEVSRGSRGKGRGDAAEGGSRGLPLVAAALSARRAAGGSLQESVGDGDRELVPKELFLLSFGSCLGQREGEEVCGRRERGVEEEGEEPVLFCCIRQWILNQLDRLPYLSIITIIIKRQRNLRVRHISTY